MSKMMGIALAVSVAVISVLAWWIVDAPEVVWSKPVTIVNINYIDEEVCIVSFEERILAVKVNSEKKCGTLKKGDSVMVKSTSYPRTRFWVLFPNLNSSTVD